MAHAAFVGVQIGVDENDGRAHVSFGIPSVEPVPSTRPTHAPSRRAHSPIRPYLAVDAQDGHVHFILKAEDAAAARVAPRARVQPIMPAFVRVDLSVDASNGHARVSFGLRPAPIRPHLVVDERDGRVRLFLEAAAKRDDDEGAADDQARLATLRPRAAFSIEVKPDGTPRTRIVLVSDRPAAASTAKLPPEAEAALAPAAEVLARPSARGGGVATAMAALIGRLRVKSHVTSSHVTAPSSTQAPSRAAAASGESEPSRAKPAGGKRMRRLGTRALLAQKATKAISRALPGAEKQPASEDTVASLGGRHIWPSHTWPSHTWPSHTWPSSPSVHEDEEPLEEATSPTDLIVPTSPQDEEGAPSPSLMPAAAPPAALSPVSPTSPPASPELRKKLQLKAQSLPPPQVAPLSPPQPRAGVFHPRPAPKPIKPTVHAAHGTIIFRSPRRKHAPWGRFGSDETMENESLTPRLVRDASDIEADFPLPPTPALLPTIPRGPTAKSAWADQSAMHHHHHHLSRSSSSAVTLDFPRSPSAKTLELARTSSVKTLVLRPGLDERKELMPRSLSSMSFGRPLSPGAEAYSPTNGLRPGSRAHLHTPPSLPLRPHDSWFRDAAQEYQMPRVLSAPTIRRTLHSSSSSRPGHAHIPPVAHGQRMRASTATWLRREVMRNQMIEHAYSENLTDY